MKIKSLDDLVLAKQQLEVEIKDQEKEILNSPIFSIPAAIFKGRSLTGALKNSMDSISVENYKRAGMNLLSTFLMANKRTRKFFVAFVIAKEMVPFVMDKINEIAKK